MNWPWVTQLPSHAANETRSSALESRIHPHYSMLSPPELLSLSFKMNFGIAFSSDKNGYFALTQK